MYIQKYLQNLTALLREKEVASDLLQQITALGEKHRTFEAEFPEKFDYDIADWLYKFWEFLHRLRNELGRKKLSDLLINACAGIKGLEALRIEFRCPGCRVFLPPFLFYAEPFVHFWSRCPDCGLPNEIYYRECENHLNEKLEILKYVISYIPRSIRLSHDIDYSLNELEFFLRRWPKRWDDESFQRANRLLRELEEIIDELKRYDL